MTQIGTSPTSSENCIAGGECYEDEFMTKHGGVKVVAPLESINWDSAAYTTHLTAEQVLDETAEQIAVVRSNGVITYIDSNLLKPGMIVRLAQGNKVPADVLIIGGDGGKSKLMKAATGAQEVVPEVNGRLQITIDTVHYDGTIGYDTFKEYMVPGPVDETNVNDYKIKVNGYNSSAVLSTWFGDATINGEQYVRSESDTPRDEDEDEDEDADYTGLTFKQNMVSLPCHIQSHIAVINRPRLSSGGAQLGRTWVDSRRILVLHVHIYWR